MNRSQDFERVYEPMDDSWLFLDVLEDELDAIAARRPTFVLEIGYGESRVGSGEVGEGEEERKRRMREV